MICAPFVQPGGPSKWLPLLSTDQGAAPTDVLGLSTVGTGFDASTGLFSWVMAGDAVLIDGYRENQVRWTRSLASLYPDIAATDIIDIAAEVSIPFSMLGTGRYGLSVGMIDRPVSSLGSASGLPYAVIAQTLASYQALGIGNTNISATNGFNGVPKLIVTRYCQLAEEAGLSGTGVGTSTLGVRTKFPGLYSISAFDSNPAMWRITIGHIHNSVVPDAPSLMTARVWHRRIKTTGLGGLP